MKKRVTRRKRKERARRSASKAAASKAANLLAYHERKAAEEVRWVRYRQEIAEAKTRRCSGCQLSLLCLAHYCPEDVMICTKCACVFSRSAKLVIYCDGYNDNMGLERAWHSGLCPLCYPETGHHLVVRGFSVDTPDVEAIKEAAARFKED